MAARTSPRPSLSEIPFRPLSGRSPAGDRRNTQAREALLSRIQGEFQEMPGLSLTVEQASRLFNLPSEACLRVLAVLENAGVLRQAGDGQYRLRNSAA
jgi:hypothetical protein